jgi:hypothetical protein
MTRVLALLAAAALLAGSPAFADDTIVTATPADAHPPGAGAPASGPLATTADARAASGGDVLMTPCGPERVNDQGVVENKPHGEISVGAGTHGYSQVGGTVCQPLPGGGFVSVSAGQSRFGR